MNYKFLVYPKGLVLGLAILLVACQTNSNIGSSPLVYTEQLHNLTEKYVYSLRLKNQHSSAAIALNPESGRMIRVFARSGINPNSTAQKNALKECGVGCYIYAINNKVVWKGLDTSTIHKSPPTEAQINRLSYSINESIPSRVRLTPDQQNDFLDYKSEEVFGIPGDTHVFAISYTGASGHGKNSNIEKAKKAAKAKCEIFSFGEPCYIYAINDKVLIDNY